MSTCNFTVCTCDGCGASVKVEGAYSTPDGWAYVRAPFGTKDSDLCADCWAVLKTHRLVRDTPEQDQSTRAQA
jgi:hypothetical protein